MSLDLVLFKCCLDPTSKKQEFQHLPQTHVTIYQTTSTCTFLLSISPISSRPPEFQEMIKKVFKVTTYYLSLNYS